MRLSGKYIIHRTEEEMVLVPTGDAAFSGMVRGNGTFGDVLELLKDGADEQEIIAALKKTYDAGAEADAVESDVRRALDELRSIGALEE